MMETGVRVMCLETEGGSQARNTGGHQMLGKAGGGFSPGSLQKEPDLLTPSASEIGFIFLASRL